MNAWRGNTLYSVFWTQINPLLLKIINNAWRHQALPQTTYQTIINVIPKPGRECNKPSDFRPISLINSDNIIITKVLNNHIAKLLPDIMHHNKTGLVQNRSLKTNIRTCISLIQHAKRQKNYLTLMAVDAEKAFDRLEWSFIFKVLELFGFPHEIITMIKKIYKLPT